MDIIGLSAKNLIYIENLLKAMMEKYNYYYIKTPILENKELLNYIKEDSDDYLDFGLKPDGTFSCVRNYLEHKLDDIEKPIKLWHYGSVFGYNEPFETYQFGVDVLGSDSPTIDVEVISLAINFYRLLGLNNFVLRINTNGDDNQLETVKEYLSALEIDYIVDDQLYSYSSYYDDITFEIITTIPELDEQLIIGNGGRYNNLIKNMGGTDTPGFGFSININNLLRVLDYDGFILHEDNGLDVYITYTDKSFISYSLNLLETLRMNGFNVEFDHTNKLTNDNDNMESTKFIIIVNQEAIEDELLTIINSRTKEEFKIEEEYIINFLDEKVSGENEEHIH